MRDINRKVDKFIKAKIAADKKSQALSPHIKFGVTASSTGFMSTAGTKKNSNRNFAMTVSFFNPRFDNPYPKEFAVRHEDMRLKNLENASPERLQSPKRNPILLDNEESVKDFKPTVKISGNLGKTTELGEERVSRFKSQGDFHPVNHVRSVSPRVEGVRTYVLPMLENSPDNVRRMRKEVNNPNTNLFNPITEGDARGVKTVKERALQTPSEALTRINDRKAILASDLGTSPRGKVFRDSNNIFAEHDPQFQVKSPRLLSPQPKREGIKGLLEYEHAPVFRDQGVSPKCSNVPFSDLVKPVEN